jgi:hypothetical protein
MAEILDVLDKEFDVSGVGDEILRYAAFSSIGLMLRILQ